MKRLISIGFTFAFLLTSSALFSQDAQQASTQVKKAPVVTAKFGEGVRFTDPGQSFKLKFEARFQTLFQGTYDLNATEDAFAGEMMIRRARLKFSGFVFKPGFEYKIELGLSNRDMQVKGKDSDYANIVLDAYMRFKLHQNLKLRVGQFKMPGNRERIISSGSLQFVDRSIINSRFNIDRDAGFMLENKSVINGVVLKQYLAMSTGEGRNRLSEDIGFCYSGRFEFLPLGEFSDKGDMVGSAIVREEAPKLSIGVSGSFNDNAQRSRGQLGDYLYESRDLSTLETDFMFKYQGFSAMGEAALRHTSHAITHDLELQEFEYVYKGKGWNAQAGYMFKSNWEVAARVSDLHPHREIQEMTDRQTDYTVALSKFWVGHNLKVQADLTLSQQNAYVSSRSDGNRLIARITTNMNF